MEVTRRNHHIVLLQKIKHYENQGYNLQSLPITHPVFKEIQKEANRKVEPDKVFKPLKIINPENKEIEKIKNFTREVNFFGKNIDLEKKIVKLNQLGYITADIADKAETSQNKVRYVLDKYSLTPNKTYYLKGEKDGEVNYYDSFRAVSEGFGTPLHKLNYFIYENGFIKIGDFIIKRVDGVKINEMDDDDCVVGRKTRFRVGDLRHAKKEEK